MSLHPRHGSLKKVRAGLDRSRVKEASETDERLLCLELVKHAPVGLMILRPEKHQARHTFKILAANQAAIALSHLNDREAAHLRGKSISDLFPSICVKDLDEALSEVVRSGRPCHLGLFQQGDARMPEHTFSVQAFSLPNHCLGLTFESISERKRAEETLRVIEAGFFNFIESAPDAMLLCDREGRILLANSQTEQLFGYQRAQLYHQPVELLVPERLRQRHLAQRTAYLTQPYRRSMGSGPELFCRRADGSEFPAEISLSAVNTEAGLMICAAIRDVTESKRAEEALRRTAAELTRSNTELDQFAHAASHDLQEPLRTVTSLAQLLSLDYSDKLDAQARSYLTSVVASAKRMQSLLDGLLKYSRVGAQRNPFDRVDLNEVCDAVVADLKVAFEQSQAQLTRDSLPAVRGDRIQLIQLFQNLLANAIKFRGTRSPRIHVSAQRRDQEWVLAVHDNGIGINPEKFDQIFLLFHRLHGREEYPGTGIGLALCKKIVAQHGGRIWVESERDAGAVFFFTLPIGEAGNNE
jgi:PAS domain S-box-containing protein